MRKSTVIVRDALFNRSLRLRDNIAEIEQELGLELMTPRTRRNLTRKLASKRRELEELQRKMRAA